MIFDSLFMLNAETSNICSFQNFCADLLKPTYILTNVHCTYSWKILMFAFATGCAWQLGMGLSLFLVQGAPVVLLLVLCNLTLDFGENSESLESSDFKVIGSGLQEELSKCTMGFALGKQEIDNISAFSLIFWKFNCCRPNI